MKTLIVAVIISVATADITTTTTSTINDTNNSESTYVTVSILTSENPESVNTTEPTDVLLSRKNGTITRQGKITEELNNDTSKSIQYRNHEISKGDRNDISQGENKELQIEFVTQPSETQRNVLRNIFERILSYKQIHLENLYNNEKEKIIKAYLLLISQKYKRKWVPNNIGIKLFTVKNITSKGRTSNKRPKRSIKEDAGFTHDAETCKQYNNNLLLLWSNLSKYIGTSEKSPPNKNVLHNIGIMIKAYLDHVTPIEMNTEAATEKLIIRRERNISSILTPIVNEIKTKIDGKEINEVHTLTAFILDQVNNFRIDNINEECNKMIQNQISSLIDLAFKKYLLYANCNNIYTSQSNGNVQILNKIAINNEKYDVPNVDEPRFDHNLLKVVKRSAIETANTTDTRADVNLTTIKDFNSSNNNNVITNEKNSSNENSQTHTIVQSRRAFQLNGKYCADLALDQFILTVKLILRLYLLNDDCTPRSNKFTIISKLIEATPILEPFNQNNLDYLSQYHVLLKLLDNMENPEMNNLFKPKAEVLQNKNTLEEFLHDINNIAISLNFKQRENNIADNTNDFKRQQLLNSLNKYQQLTYNTNDRILNTKNAEPISNTGFNVILSHNGNKKDNQNYEGYQGIHTGVPIKQHFEANRSIIYENLTNRYKTNPIEIGATINSGNINYNNYLSASDNKNQIISSATEKENSEINPIQYNLSMNYSKTYPANIKGNFDLLDNIGPLPYFDFLNGTNVNPFRNTLLHQNFASNSGSSSYFSKFTNTNNEENQPNNSPSLPNGVVMNLLTNNNNGAMLNNNFNTKSEVTIHEANEKKYLRNPALQQNVNAPSNFGLNPGVNYYNQINNALTNMDSNILRNHNFNLLRDNNLYQNKNSFNPFNFINFNDLRFKKPNVLRVDEHEIKNSDQPNGNFVLRNSSPLGTLNVPQIQKTPVIFRTDIKLQTLNDTIVNRSSNVNNSSYNGSQPIQASKISGVPLKNDQTDENHRQDLSKNLFINPFSYTAKGLLNQENEFENYFNAPNIPVLRSHFLRTYNQKLETKPAPILSVDNLPTISSDPDANGDVELTYVFHHPQIIVYQPQVLVKRRISYVDYIKNFNKIFNNQRKNQQQLHLYKIIRYLPHNNVQVLYQSDNLSPILKVENITSTN